jgi:hypothetical protein
MEKTTTELTNEYIKEHPDIKSCMKKGLINYSSLSRLIAKELGIGKKTSKEAILIAARRFREKLKKEQSFEKQIKELMEKTELEIKNKIIVFILQKSIDLDSVNDIQKTIRNESGRFYLLEGSDSYTIITQEKYSNLLEKKFKSRIITKHKDLALINFKTPRDVEQMIGWLSYFSSLFAEHGVNILEFLSCWTDNIFVIDKKDVNKAIEFLKF